jgi:ATP-dependent Lhr-like helicase
MGIDVGAVLSIAQVGAPFSVASMRQRIGRSGRRAGDPAIARFYVTVPDAEFDLDPQDALYPELVQMTAILKLLLEGWCEPPIIHKLHLSTLIQQLLSLIAQQGGIRPDHAWQTLCGTGPFRSVDPGMFMRLLKCLGQHELILQSEDKSLLLGEKGDRIVSHYSFYSAFATPQEYRILHQGKSLGTLPTNIPLLTNALFIFGGKRWRALTVDDFERMVEVEESATAKRPKFSGGVGQVHDRIRQEMFRLYCSDEVPAFLDPTAQALLAEARANFAAYGLEKTAVIDQGKQTLLFCWQGDVVLNTILVQLMARGLKVGRDDGAIAVQKVSPSELMMHLGELVDEGAADAIALAATVSNKRLEKHDQFLSDELLCFNYAASHLDTQKAWTTLQQIVDKPYA